jgi:hypothetical protein
VEAQLRHRWRGETSGGPELFGYFETVFPFQKDHSLIGTSVWEIKYGLGLARSTSWGTLVARAAVGWAEGSPETGEYAVEYIRGVSNRLRFYGAVEGSQDEVELITEVQVFLAPAAKLKLNSALGLTRKPSRSNAYVSATRAPVSTGRSTSRRRAGRTRCGPSNRSRVPSLLHRCVDHRR